jgi:hypothetical protein
MYLDEFESMAAPLCVALRELMGFILLAFRWMLPESGRTRKFKGVEERERERERVRGWPRSHLEEHG